MSDVLLGGRWVLAIVFLAAGVAKLRPSRRSQVATAIDNYGVLPRVLVRPVVSLLPWLEILLGVFLAAGVLIVIAAFSAVLILGVFASVVGWHLVHNRSFGCGCGSGGSISWALTRRDAALCALAVAVAAGPSGGLAAWPGCLSQDVKVSWQAQLPVPLATVLMMSAIRLLSASRVIVGRRSALPPASGAV